MMALSLGCIVGVSRVNKSYCATQRSVSESCWQRACFTVNRQVEELQEHLGTGVAGVIGGQRIMLTLEPFGRRVAETCWAAES